MNIKFLIIFLMLTFHSSDSYSQTIIKMKRQSGVSVIPCKVNGLNLNFIFDTGASDVSLSMIEAVFMLKNGYLSKSDIEGTSKFSDANGNINEGVVINLKEIVIGELILYNVKASVVTNIKAPLLLGQSAISKLGKIQLDLEQNTLTILSGRGFYDLSKDNHQPINSVIGNSTKLGNIEIAQYDFPKKMNWDDAKIACAALGEGWRLPTKEELKILYKNKNKIGVFVNELYWSSTEFNDDLAWYEVTYVSFDFQSKDKKTIPFYVRAIRFYDLSKDNQQPINSVIGNSIKLENFEISEFDFPNQMNWDDAKKACAALGEGWRLPTKKELNILYQNKDKIGGFANNYYWSSTEDGSNYAWFQYFDTGLQFIDKYGTNYVRAVRAL